MMASSQLLSANRSFIAIASHESRTQCDHPRCFAVSMRSLSANRGFIAIALCESRFSSRSLSANRGFHRDRSRRITDSSRSLSANRGIIAIALAIRGIRAIALANRRVFIAIALSESRYHRDRSRQIAASARSLSRIAGS